MSNKVVDFYEKRIKPLLNQRNLVNLILIGVFSITCGLSTFPIMFAFMANCYFIGRVAKRDDLTFKSAYESLKGGIKDAYKVFHKHSGKIFGAYFVAMGFFLSQMVTGGVGLLSLNLFNIALFLFMIPLGAALGWVVENTLNTVFDYIGEKVNCFGGKVKGVYNKVKEKIRPNSNSIENQQEQILSESEEQTVKTEVNPTPAPITNAFEAHRTAAQQDAQRQDATNDQEHHQVLRATL